MSQTNKILLGIGLVAVTAIGGYFIVTAGLGEKEQPTVRVEIPDGLRKEQIAFILAGKLGWNDEQVKKFVEKDTSPMTAIQEGYSAPGVYNIPTNASTYDVAMMMRQSAQEVHYQYKSKLKNEDWDQALIVASIIQKEMEGHAEDRFEIAKKIWADLDAKRPIKSDATIAYLRDTRVAYGESWCEGKPEVEKTPDCYQDWRLQFNVSDARNIEWWKSVTDQDRTDDWDAFNTYLHAGLPMRAISNPSRDAIDAAVTTRFTPTGEIIGQ